MILTFVTTQEKFGVSMFDFAKSNLSCNYSKRSKERFFLEKNRTWLKRHWVPHWFLNKNVFTQNLVDSAFIVNFPCFKWWTASGSFKCARTPIFKSVWHLSWRSNSTPLAEKVFFLCLNGKGNFLELIDDVKSKRRRIFFQFNQLNVSGYLFLLKAAFLRQKLLGKKNG